MKTILVIIILCCNTQTDSGYQYEAKNVETNQVGNLYSVERYNEGDTVKLEINKR